PAGGRPLRRPRRQGAPARGAAPLPDSRSPRLVAPARGATERFARRSEPRRLDLVRHGRRHSGGEKRPSMAVQPPSTRSSEPVTKLAASDARNTTAPTSSLGCAQRFRALLSAYAWYHAGWSLICFVSGVSTTPGATALARTPLGPSSAAMARIICSVPALVA